MKQLTIIPLFVSGVALGQSSIAEALRWNGDAWQSNSITSPVVTIGGVLGGNDEPQVKQVFIKQLVRVVIDDNGLLKTIDAFKVVTKQRVYWASAPCPGYPQGTRGFGMGVTSACAVAHFKEYTEDIEYHYEDKEGNVLSEVYQLIKL